MTSPIKPQTLSHGGVFLPPRPELDTQKLPIKHISPEPGEFLYFHLSHNFFDIIKSDNDYKLNKRVLAGELVWGNGKDGVYSSISGYVRGVYETMSSDGNLVDSICIENDGLDERAPRRPAADPIAHVREQILDIARRSRIDVFIINAVEADPFITGAGRLVIETGKKLMSGVRLLKQAFPKVAVIFAVSSTNREALDALDKEAGDNLARILPIIPKYPQDSDKFIIKTCTGRNMSLVGMPSDVGCIVISPEELLALYESVTGKHFTEKIITLGGDAVREPGNYLVPIGLPFAALISAAGGLYERPAKIICGNRMTGVELLDIETPVTKHSSALICLTEKETVANTLRPSHCINCGKCAKVCPMRLTPYLPRKTDACVSCRCCAYICPSHCLTGES